MKSHELAALADLIRIFADADGKISPGESEAVDRIATEVGQAAFWAKFQDTAFSAAREIDIEEVAMTVDDTSTRSRILEWLSQLAEADGLHSVEHGKLVRLRGLWKDE